MRLRVAAVLVLTAAAGRAAPPSPGAAEVAGLLPGTYRSRDSAGAVRFVIASVPKSRVAEGAAVFYVEAGRTAQPGMPFLQRFLLLEDGGGRVVLRVFEPRDLAGVRGKWREPESLALFGPRDVRERPDCRITLAKSPAGNWAGGTAAATCFSAAANAPLAVTLTLSPQTLEWREEGKDAAGKTVHGAAGEVSVYGREREGTAPAAGTIAPAPPAAAVAAPVASGAAGSGGVSSKVNGAAPQAPPVLEVLGSAPPSKKKYDLAELRGMAAGATLPLSRLVSFEGSSAAAVVVVTSRTGSLSVFSLAEISSSDSPSLDVSGATPRLVAAGGRGLDDVRSVELRVLSPAK